MVPFDRWRRSSYWLSIVTNYGSITASFPSKSETLVENRDFFILVHSTLPLAGPRRNIAIPFGMENYSGVATRR